MPVQSSVPPVPYPPGQSVSRTTSPFSSPRSQSVLMQVLHQRSNNNNNNHSADQLFSVSDFEILTELHQALPVIKRIFSDPGFVDSRSDQSVVELAMSRAMAAIRDSSCMETYAPALVDVLESSLHHPMSLVLYNGHVDDSPHCRIAQEIMSSLFLYHSKKAVMIVAIPAAVKALSSLNAEFVRSTSSYLALAAIHNGKLVAQYAVQIISNVLGGNYSLLRVFPLIYRDNREPFHAHLVPLFELLPNPGTDTSEKLSLLQLASHVLHTKPDLIIPFLPVFEDFLQSPTTCTAVLHIYMSIITMGRGSALISQLIPMKRAIRQHTPTQSNLVTMAKVIGSIGRLSRECAALAVPDLIELCHKSNSQNLPILLKEIGNVAEVYPFSAQHHLGIIKVFAERNSCLSMYQRIEMLCNEEKRHHEEASSKRSLLDSDGVRLRLSPQYPTSYQSAESVHSRRSSSKHLPNDPGPNVLKSTSSAIDPLLPPRKPFRLPHLEQIYITSLPTPKTEQDLDRNTRHLAELYKMRSNGSLSNQRPPNSVVEDGKTRRSSALAVAGGFSVSPTQLALLSTPVSVGKDGRVRPQPRPRNLTVLENGSIGFRTTFPVASADSPITTSSLAIDNSRLPPKRSGSQSRPKSSNSNSHSTTKSRAHSSDTLGRMSSSRTTSDWMEDRGDVVRQFVDHRRSKVVRFVHEISKKYPIPSKCSAQGPSAKTSRMFVHFSCQEKNQQYCLNSQEAFAFKTKIPAVWIHLLFLQLQASAIESNNRVLPQDSEEFEGLLMTWSRLPKDVTKSQELVTLVTSAFPTEKEQSQMLKELQDSRYFDSFTFDAVRQRWVCFACAHPEKVKSLIKTAAGNNNMPLLEGQLQEKKGRWMFLKRWHTKYFTLSSAGLTSTSSGERQVATQNKPAPPTIDLRKVRSVRSLSRGRQSRKSLPRAFEIFTDDEKSYVLKASDRSKAEEWLQYLQIAITKAQRDRRLPAITAGSGSSSSPTTRKS